MSLRSRDAARALQRCALTRLGGGSAVGTANGVVVVAVVVVVVVVVAL